MRLLLDTHAFLWWVADDRRLPRRARAAITNPTNECLVSVASCWEMAIKVSIGKLTLPAPVERFVPDQLATNGFRLLPIELAHAARVAKLPRHHGDPFDRLLIAQSLIENLSMVSAESILGKYGVQRLW